MTKSCQWGALLFLPLLIYSCAKGPKPKDVLVEFLRQDLPSGDSTAVMSKLDREALTLERKADFTANGDSARLQRYNSDSLLSDLLPGGELFNRWLSYNIIVSQTKIEGDTAWVEVSFIDAEKSVQYYNQMGLYRNETGWRIFSFRRL